MMLRTFVLFLYSSLLIGNAVHGQTVRTADEQKVVISTLLKQLQQATSDQRKDSINDGLKEELGALLRRDDAFALNLEDLPLSRVDAPDGSFRLLTWNVPKADGSHRYEGWLAVHDRKGNELHALVDGTAKITAPEVPELGADRWYGALYYQVIPVKKGAKTYYTLLGWKGQSRVETRKVIEVLHFKGGQPRFGAPLFGIGRIRATRKVFGFSYQASMMLKYDAASQRIIMDHLSPARPDMEGQWAFYGPDLSSDAFLWDKDHWRFERDVDLRNMERDRRPFNAPPPGP